MNTTWIVENFTTDNGYEELIAELDRQNITFTVLDLKNHFELNSSVINAIKDHCVVFQGSIEMFRKLKQETDLKPLGWMTDDNYLCSRYFPKFQEFLFNDKYSLVSLAGLKANKFFYYGVFGKDANIYVRPDRGDKTFKGQLLDLQYFDSTFNNALSSIAKDDDLVLISTPKNIRGEWRFICSHHKEIIAFSTYMYQGNRTYIPSAPKGATDLCKKILDVGYYPDPVFTVDIAEDTDGNYWLIEMNSFTSAGTYAANKKNIVTRVSEIAQELIK